MKGWMVRERVSGMGGGLVWSMFSVTFLAFIQL